MANSYDIKRIRIFLTKGFSVDDLRRFCYDDPGFRRVYYKLPENPGRSQIIDAMIEHAEQTLQMDKLLTWAEEQNPARYVEHQPYFLSNTPVAQTPIKQETIVPTLLSIEIDKNLDLLREFWREANEIYENEANSSPEKIRLLLADLSLPHWSFDVLDSQPPNSSLVLSEEKIRQILDLRSELKSISDRFFAITSATPSKIKRDTGSFNFVRTIEVVQREKISELWGKLETIIKRVLERGNPLTGPSENEKVLRVFKSEEQNTARTISGRDLYDKRYALYSNVKDTIALILRDAYVEMSTLFTFKQSTDEAYFLFGDDIRDYLDEIYQKGNLLHTIGRMLESLPVGDERNRSVEKEMELLNWFINQLEAAKIKFSKYLSVE